MSDKTPASPRTRGLGLRSKLVLGFIGLVAILLAVGVESITLLDRLGGSIDVILRENYKSVVACERMKEALERMDSGALFGLAGEEVRGRSLATEYRPRFEAALQTELGNITLPGEGERAERLRQLYATFGPILDRVLDPAIPVEERRALYFGRLLPTFQQIKTTADEILHMNQQNMVDANDQARTLASRASRRMAVLLLLGTALAGLGIAFLFRTVLVPLERLTRASRLAGAARDLDGALMPVRKTLEALKAEPTPLTPSQEDLLDSVRQETDRLGQIAQNLLALSRGEESQAQLRLKPAAPRDLIEDAVSAAAGSAASQQVTLVTEVDRGAPSVLADRKRIGQVFSSLLQNAIAHTAADGSVIVRAEPDGNQARFSVNDTGGGIAPEHRERIFEPFYQVPGTEDLGGVGLGLAVARDIVRDHDGEIRCESEEGKGTTFWFTLPAAIALIILLAVPAGSVLAQEAPIATDRPGFLFSSLTVGRGVVQAELGLPSITLNESDDVKVRSTSLAGLLRFGVTDDLELRLGAPVYTETRVEFGPFDDTDSGYGDLEVGAKWHILDNDGGRPSFALIPSVILPTGEDGFTADDPVYQLIAMAEWTLASGWGIGVLGGILNGPSGDDRFNQETFGLAAGRSLGSPAWSAYGEIVHIITDLDGASDSSFAGGGLKFLVSNDVQLDASFDRGLTDDSPDWLFGLGLAARF